MTSGVFSSCSVSSSGIHPSHFTLVSCASLLALLLLPGRCQFVLAGKGTATGTCTRSYGADGTRCSSLAWGRPCRAARRWEASGIWPCAGLLCTRGIFTSRSDSQMCVRPKCPSHTRVSPANPGATDPWEQTGSLHQSSACQCSCSGTRTPFPRPVFCPEHAASLQTRPGRTHLQAAGEFKARPGLSLPGPFSQLQAQGQPHGHTAAGEAQS